MTSNGEMDYDSDSDHQKPVEHHTDEDDLQQQGSKPCSINVNELDIVSNVQVVKARLMWNYYYLQISRCYLRICVRCFKVCSNVQYRLFIVLF